MRECDERDESKVKENEGRWRETKGYCNFVQLTVHSNTPVINLSSFVLVLSVVMSRVAFAPERRINVQS